MKVFGMCDKTAAALIGAYSVYNCLGSGRHRIVYDIGDGLVVKIPLPWAVGWGIAANVEEYEISAGRREFDLDGAEFAKVHSIEYYNGVPVIVMDKVEPVTSYSKDLPSWTNHIDSQQVGYNSTGRLVAYDYSII